MPRENIWNLVSFLFFLFFLMKLFEGKPYPSRWWYMTEWTRGETIGRMIFFFPLAANLCSDGRFVWMRRYGWEVQFCPNDTSLVYFIDCHPFIGRWSRGQIRHFMTKRSIVFDSVLTFSAWFLTKRKFQRSNKGKKESLILSFALNLLLRYVFPLSSSRSSNSILIASQKLPSFLNLINKGTNFRSFHAKSPRL